MYLIFLTYPFGTPDSLPLPRALITAEARVTLLAAGQVSARPTLRPVGQTKRVTHNN